MDGHKGAVRDVLKGVFNGVETRKATFHHLLWTGKALLCTVLSPPAYMGLRKHCNNVYSGHCFNELFNCQTQNWLAVKQQELLGDIGPHAHAGAACRND